MDGADPATLTPERRLAPEYEAELRAAIMENIVAHRNAGQNIGLYAMIYGLGQEAVRAQAASLEYARRLREYRQAYADASTSREVGAFVAAWKDFDPDGLRPKARLRIKQLRAAEAKAERALRTAERVARKQAARETTRVTAREAAREVARDGAPSLGQQQGEGPGSENARPAQAGRITVTAYISTPGNYDIALRIDNYNGSPDGESPGYISDKSEWWHSKTIGKGYNGRIGGRYKFEVKFRNVRNVVCTGTFSPDSSKRTFKIQLHEDCTDAGSNAY